MKYTDIKNTITYDGVTLKLFRDTLFTVTNMLQCKQFLAFKQINSIRKHYYESHKNQWCNKDSNLWRFRAF